MPAEHQFLIVYCITVVVHGILIGIKAKGFWECWLWAFAVGGPNYFLYALVTR